jgi:hypothetical protein|tara:strand:- start:4684 stop:5064 length:381 start_codon:yes stop_codon:yes gene_type:complete
MKQTFLRFPNTVEVYTKTVTTNAAGQKKAAFSLNSTIKCSAQSGSGNRTLSGYISEIDSYTMIFSHEDSSLIVYNNRFKNLKDISGTVIEVGPLEIGNIEKKLGISGKINHLIASVSKVKEGSEND